MITVFHCLPVLTCVYILLAENKKYVTHFCVILTTDFGNNTSTSCARGRHNMPPPRYKLTFNLLTLKVVSDGVSYLCANFSLPICSLDLGPIYATDGRQTASSHNAPAYYGWDITSNYPIFKQ